MKKHKQGSDDGLPAHASSEPLLGFSATTRDWFGSAFARPTDAQQQAWQTISRGEHTLVVAGRDIRLRWHTAGHLEWVFEMDAIMCLSTTIGEDNGERLPLTARTTGPLLVIESFGRHVGLQNGLQRPGASGKKRLREQRACQGYV